MLMTVEPHDLAARCAECGTTLAAVSSETGLTERELLEFASGRLPLCARDRLNVFLAVTKHARPAVTPNRPSLDLLLARDRLLNEVQAELQQEEDTAEVNESIH